ncbi:MAG: hypothetical protein KGD58_08190 [Candidatus Lokiarchaeota archaeon]|nr:hypothetical protein [Candidatus Lokiarchaeota archaeon]
MALLKKKEKTKMSKFEGESINPTSILISLPACYGNFKSISNSCRHCYIKDKCKRLVPPKEPLWCNNP